MSLKQNIFNDPIYGFITVPDPLIMQVINHPYYLRLQRIRQLGLTSMVYPGALHTRFQHAMGAMHLTQKAIQTLRLKGIQVSKQEETGVLIAILLHDIGHGPFSHALEHSIVSGIHHEDLTLLFLEQLDKEFKGKLKLAREIFSGKYRKKFLSQLVSGQLDMDRLDYLLRDSFFTGVSEGVVSSDRIIKMLNVKNNQLVVDSKGIYSIEKFIIARRLMYWQVYLHKTVLSAEFLLVKILQRAKEIMARGEEELFCTPALRIFMERSVTRRNIELYMDSFALLDDSDIFACVKAWMLAEDKVLNRLCSMLVNRRLYKVLVQNEPFSPAMIRRLKKKVQSAYRISERETDLFVFTEKVTNDAYNPDKIQIKILQKSGAVSDIAKVSDHTYLRGLQKTVKKYFLFFPKEFFE